MNDKTFSVRTSEREQILLITEKVERALGELTSGDGICTIVVPHTTCAISVNENADPDVPADLSKALRALVQKSASSTAKATPTRTFSPCSSEHR